jgi:hypothetical protein
VKGPAQYRAMEALCREHAKLDKKTAKSWLEKADLWSKLIKVEQRLLILRKALPESRQEKRPSARKA